MSGGPNLLPVMDVAACGFTTLISDWAIMFLSLAFSLTINLAIPSGSFSSMEIVI